jgi:flavin-binding protein dodecin
MEDHVYRLSEVVGTSSEGIDQAIRNAVARANQTLRNLDWFQVSEIRGVISGDEVAQCQVTLKLGFRLEE